MSKKWLFALSGAALAALLLVGALGATAALAQEPTPTTDATGATDVTLPPGGPHGGPGRGPGCGEPGFLGGHNDWTMFDTAAEALGLTPVELFTELHDGNTLEQIAEARGVAIEDVQAALSAARVEAMRQNIAQAVEDGTMTQAQADWMLEGLEQGFLPMGRGFFGRGPHGENGFPTDGD